MSIFGAMQSGISGLAAQSTAMGSISDNISNVNTVGYKNNNVAFSTLVTKQTSSSHYSPGGVQPMSKQNVNAQGLLAANASSTALAVSGNGYFVVNSAANPQESDVWAYTRAGDFDIDDRGYLKNTSNFYLQGWSLLPWDGNPNATVVNYNGINYMKAYYDQQGNTVYINDNIVDSQNLRPVNLSTIGGSATPTSQINYGANLPSGDPIFNAVHPQAGGRHSINALIYDSLGNASNLNLTYTKQSSNTWGLSASLPKGSASVTLTGNRESAADGNPDVYYAAGQLEFTSIPDAGSIIKIRDQQTEQDFYFEFTKDPAHVGNTQGNKHIAVDITSGIVTASDLTQRMAEIIHKTMPGASRFQADGNRIVIEQSIGGGALEIDASKTLSCVQSAANPDESGVPTGIFDIKAIDPELKNIANLSFTDNTLANYTGKTFTINGQEFEFVATTPEANAPNKIDLSKAALAGDGTHLDLVQLAEITANAIKGYISEPARVTISGTSIQFTPTSTGGDIELDFQNLKAQIKGFGRNSTDAVPPMADLGEGVVTLSNQFKVNNTEIESGAIVPSVKFNADGTPKYYFVDSLSIEWANGAQNMNGDYGHGTPISLNMGNVGTNDGITSLAGNFNTNYIKQDGAKFGSYAGVSVDENGIVTALYDNGETRPIAILPLATFSNPNGMGALTGNSWIETDMSGQALLKMANTNGAGKIEANSLEQSTVDLATEFSNMIITQRAYSAATKIITTADEMLEELTRMS